MAIKKKKVIVKIISTKAKLKDEEAEEDKTAVPMCA